MNVRYGLALAWLLSPKAAGAEKFPALAEALLSSAPFQGASVGVFFASLDKGRAVYSRNPDLALEPASVAKLATTAAALEALTPDFRFKTSLLARKDELGRRSISALVWRGSGDPSISGRDRSGPYEIFGLWGASLTARGIQRVKRLVLDERFFEGPAVVASWPPDELSYWYEAETSAIAFNDNCVDLRFYPGRRLGRRAEVALEPDIGYVKAVNRTVTGPPHSRFTLDYRRELGANRVTFFGSIGSEDGVRSDYVSVHEPALFAARALREAWKKSGPKLGRKAVFWDKSGLQDAELAEVMAWESEPLSKLIKVVNTNSQNFYAEQILKTLGRQAQGRGSFEAGLGEVNHFLKKAGLGDGEYRLVDGSGLSEENRLTPRGVVKILRHMRASHAFDAYFDSLAIPGVDRSVKDRMSDEPLARQMRLKRGTVAHARNLAGYLRSRSGRLYAFAVLVNGSALDRPAIDAALDRLCVAAARSLP